MRRAVPAALFVFGAAILSLPAGRVAAQEEGGWFFCYVDPPTFNRGAFVYTQVNYIGRGAIPRDEITDAMNEANPQVAGRSVSCWRYATQEEAERRRQQGMAHDRSRNYTIRELSWAPANPVSFDPPPSAFVLPPEDTFSFDEGAVEDAGSAFVALPSEAEALAGEGDTAPTAPAEFASSAAETSVAATVPESPVFEAPPPEPDAGVAEANLQMLESLGDVDALNKQAEAEYRRALEAHRQELADLAARNEQERQRHEQIRARWEADVAACNAGDFSKCAAPPN